MATTVPRYTIGLMSGTSLDGVDGVLVDFLEGLQVVASSSRAFPADFRAELLALNQAGGAHELHRAAMTGNRLALLYAEVVADLMAQPAAVFIGKAAVSAIGAHGQTVRHHPHASQGLPGYSIQLNNPALLAERTGMAVVADFRSRDIAAGGQGAPLVPAFHQQVFGQLGQTVAVLNVGGMANLSIVPPARANSPKQLKANPDIYQVKGFDCGPGNVLIDAWCQQQTGNDFDADGAWAAQGTLVPALLESLLDMPFFAKQPPKSCGRDDFSCAWLAEKLAPFISSTQPVDIQKTLTELTASAAVSCMSSYGNDSKKLIVCGGGALNRHLLQCLQAGLPTVEVVTSDVCGLPALLVEATAFAWLARPRMEGLPGNLPNVTGAAGLRVLGAIYPA